MTPVTATVERLRHAVKTHAAGLREKVYEQRTGHSAIDRTPDLLIEFAEYAWLRKGNVKKRADSLWDTIEVEPGNEHVYVGSHRHERMFVLAGPSAAQAPRTLAEIQDIAPTALYLLAEPLPTQLEGRIVAEALEPTLLGARPPAHDDRELEVDTVGAQSSYSEGEADEVEARLLGLGYLE